MHMDMANFRRIFYILVQLKFLFIIESGVDIKYVAFMNFNCSKSGNSFYVNLTYFMVVT